MTEPKKSNIRRSRKSDEARGAAVRATAMETTTMAAAAMVSPDKPLTEKQRAYAVARAFALLTSDRRVRAVLVNVFGGIVRCDLVVRGLVRAARTGGTRVPVVMRLEGTNVELGKSIIRNSGLNVIPADNLADAAQKIVNAVKG